MRILYILFLVLIAQNSFADVYPSDTFGMHKLCISNPWAGTNFKGDATSTFPCHYDYAIVHVPTLLQEMNTQILNSTVSVDLKVKDPLILELPQPDWSRFSKVFSLVFGSTFGLMWFAFGAGLIPRLFTLITGKRML